MKTGKSAVSGIVAAFSLFKKQSAPTASTKATVRSSSTGVSTAGSSGQRQESSSQKYSPLIPLPPVVMYYGANIGQFSPKIRDWIVNQAFTKDKMEDTHGIDPQLKAQWSTDGNAVLCEASCIVASGYVGAGTRKMFRNAHYSGGDLRSYGQYAKYQTLKFEYDLKREAEYRIAKDPAYAEVITFAKKLCTEIEYDWTNFSAYKGAKPIRTPGKRYAVCAGYSNEVMDKVLTLNCAQFVEEWTSPGHAWNVLHLVDGRTLYFDLTWFDNHHIDEKTGRIYQTDDYKWKNITFNEALFRHSNIGYGSRTFCHNQGIDVAPGATAAA